MSEKAKYLYLVVSLVCAGNVLVNSVDLARRNLGNLRGLHEILGSGSTSFVLRLIPAAYVPNSLRGKMAHYAGNNEDARRYLELALEDRPRDSITAYWLARELLAQGNTSQALEIIRSTDKVGMPAGLCRDAKELLVDEGDARSAIAFADAIATVPPQSSTAYSCLGELYELANVPERALEMYRLAAEWEPRVSKRVQFLIMAGDLQLKTKEYEGALQAYIDALFSDPRRHQIRNRIAYAYLRLKRYDEAEQELQAVLRASPRDLQALIRMGWVSEARGQLEQAAAWYEEAQRTNPKSSDGWRYAGRLALRQGNLEVAIEKLRVAVEVEPNRDYNWHTLADALEEKGAYGEAQKVYEQALRSIDDEGQGAEIRKRLMELGNSVSGDAPVGH